ncbi:hypothetical protein PVIIG_05913 [Plasmodium vivax India VII]|uniref:Uncharacterized protein n=1 Tax=Plasmodium vivax India VII TaxID=1077284 RepID=A0A0J9UT32_PLAVI|nr:hypothetical protein PVIIG_05913 [Plasmodium vivax India VII]
MIFVFYLFLKHVWDIYYEYDSTVENNTKNHQIYTLCHIILTTLSENKAKYNNFCTKLIRNLGLFSENSKSFIRSNDRCNILYNWIYNSIKKEYIPDSIINKCFEDYIDISSMIFKINISMNVKNMKKGKDYNR